MPTRGRGQPRRRRQGQKPKARPPRERWPSRANLERNLKDLTPEERKKVIKLFDPKEYPGLPLKNRIALAEKIVVTDRARGKNPPASQAERWPQQGGYP